MKILATGAALGMILAATSGAFAQEASATAAMKNAEGADVGTVTFNQTASGMLHVIVEMTDLTPGPHALHVHETGACDAAGGFESAGAHYAADGETHGVDSVDGPHAGDFPNVHVGQDGILKAEFFTDRLSIDGDMPLKDEDGSAVIVHADPDDHATHPTGEAGDRMACGVVE